ncbi:MAG: protein-L-isoaspartate O-methyltransferase family protein [Candidatus Dojkabacteria bacterium]
MNNDLTQEMAEGSRKFVWDKNHLLQTLHSGKNPIIKDLNVINALREVDREDFVINPQRFSEEIHADKDIPIDFGQFQESPVLIAQKLQTLAIRAGAKVLEIGAGTGYVTAIIAVIVGDSGKLYALERNQQLVEQARYNLGKRKYKTIAARVELMFRDGSKGLISKSPYDAIYVAAAYEQPPKELLEQLKLGGRMILPLINGDLKLYVRTDENQIEESLISAKNYKQVLAGVE